MPFPGKKIKTVKIKSDDHESGFVIINECDFDESKHKLFKKESNIVFISREQAEAMNRDELREYAKPFGITDTSKDRLLEKLIEAKKISEPE